MTHALTVQHIETNQVTLLDELRRRQAVVRDYVRGVALGYATGLYLFGRPGTAKTYTVRQLLDTEIREPYLYTRGHLTPMGLYDLLLDHSNEVLVLDDLVTIFRSSVAIQLLLAALEFPANQPRVITYRRRGNVLRATFSGGIVCITNRELHDDELLDAFKSRVHVLNYDPADAHLGALMLAAAQKGVGDLSPDAATEVARYLIAEMLRLDCRFDLRLFFDKAVTTYRQWKDDATESHWRDLVTASIEEHLIAVRHDDETRPEMRANRKAVEQALVQQLLRDYTRREERIEAWIERTGKSERAFYRRLGEIEV